MSCTVLFYKSSVSFFSKRLSLDFPNDSINFNLFLSSFISMLLTLFILTFGGAFNCLIHVFIISLWFESTDSDGITLTSMMLLQQLTRNTSIIVCQSYFTCVAFLPAIPRIFMTIFVLEIHVHDLKIISHTEV